MKSPPFEYARAASIEEACGLLRQHGDAAKLIAGGQSLVPMMAMRLLRPRRLIDINEIAALKFVAFETDAVRIGACTRQCVVERDDALAARVPLLRQALAWVGHAQTRNRGTVGGSLAHADPAAELPLVAQVLGARLVLRAKSGTRTLPAAEFFAGPLMTTAGRTNASRRSTGRSGASAKTGSAFTEVSRRHGDFAMVAAAAQVALDDDGPLHARGVRRRRRGADAAGVSRIGAAARRPAARTRRRLRAVAQEAAAALEPESDIHASAAYRRHLAGVLAARVLQRGLRHREDSAMSEALYPISVEVNGRNAPAR